MQTVEYLLPYTKELISMESTSTIEAIQTEMIAKNVSHIPIIDQNRHKNIGLVRRKMIWIRMLQANNKNLSLKDLQDPPLPSVDINDPLAMAMQKLEGTSGVLIRDQDKCYTRFISPRVVAMAFKDYSERFQVIENLETIIKKRLELISETDLMKTLELDSEGVKRLTFSHYHTVFSKLWDSLGLSFLDQKSILNLIEKVREYRNSVMHYRLKDNEEGKTAATELINLLEAKYVP